MKNGPYLLIRAPDNYPGKKYREKYVYEHHLVWWQNTGELVDTSKDLIHHLDGNKHNNDFLNLAKKKRGVHSAEHSPKPKMIDLECAWCGKIFSRELRHHKSRKKNGYLHSFCCPSHQVKFQWKHQGQKDKIFRDG